MNYFTQHEKEVPEVSRVKDFDGRILLGQSLRLGTVNTYPTKPCRVSHGNYVLVTITAELRQPRRVVFYSLRPGNLGRYRGVLFTSLLCPCRYSSFMILSNNLFGSVMFEPPKNIAMASSSNKEMKARNAVEIREGRSCGRVLTMITGKRSWDERSPSCIRNPT